MNPVYLVTITFSDKVFKRDIPLTNNEDGKPTPQCLNFKYVENSIIHKYFGLVYQNITRLYPPTENFRFLETNLGWNINIRANMVGREMDSHSYVHTGVCLFT